MNGELDWVVSVDDHVIEPAHVWQDRMPAKLKDAAPRLERDEEGEFWAYEGRRYATWGLTAAAGSDKEDFSPHPITYEEMRPSCYDPKARLEDMNRDRVLVQGTFPSFPRLAGQVFYEGEDRELALACVQAYNDFIIDEWSGAAPGRFIPTIITPLWDPVQGAREIERCAAKGAKAISFSENPTRIYRGRKNGRGIGALPSIHDNSGYWEPVFQAANDTGMPICIHIGSSNDMETTSTDAPMAVTASCVRLVSPQKVAIDWLFSGWFRRLQNLKICLSEGGVGWIPAALDICDYHVRQSYGWASKHGDFKVTGQFLAEARSTDAVGHFQPFTMEEQMSPDLLPSALFRRHMYGCFLQDEYGAKVIDEIGADNIMLESDFPHSDSTWPNTVSRAHRVLADCTDEQKLKIFRTNAVRVFNFEPAAVPMLSPA
jgi:predicted TIM-barrel fold metal-dependent hydrolase